MGSLRTEASRPTEFRQFSKIDNLFKKKRKQASKVLRRKYVHSPAQSSSKGRTKVQGKLKEQNAQDHKSNESNEKQL